MEARQALIDELGLDIGDRRVLRAMAEVPRDRFVPARLRAQAWENRALPIGQGQTISQPLVVARMCELLELQGDETVLDAGTGSDYHAAVLARLAAPWCRSNTPTRAARWPARSSRGSRDRRPPRVLVSERLFRHCRPPYLPRARRRRAPPLQGADPPSEDGDSPADRVLQSFGAPTVPPSKYRVGLDGLHRGGDPDSVEELFVREP